MSGFNFPPIKIVRGFLTTDHSQTLTMTGGVSPQARLPIGDVAQGATIRIHGNASAVNGTITFVAGGNAELQLTTPGDFDCTFNLVSDTDYVQISGATNDTATFTAIYVKVS